MIAKKQILGGLMIYFAIRIFAYFYSPTTPLYAANPINWLLSGAILATALYFLWKKDIRGWLIIAAEIILGGAGGLLEIKGLSLRTLLLISSLAIFFYQTLRDKEFNQLFENKIVAYLIVAILGIGAISAMRGYYMGHSLGLIIADTIPYLFFLYYFPLKKLLLSEHFKNAALNMIIAAIIGSVIFSFFTFILYSAGVGVLQDNYYHWFRDVAAGKITEYGFHFYRTTLNEHLLLIPLLLFFVAHLMANKPAKQPSLAIAGLMLAILSINLTRIYIVAMGIGLLFLFSKSNWKRWLLYSTATIVGFFLIFTTVHLLSSRGQSLGWEFFGLRIKSIALPATENSSLSRLLLLPKILEKIKAHPVLGTGLGDVVTVQSPIFGGIISTPHFDWGYLEIMAETGIIGLIVWILIIGYCLFKTKDWALRAALISLLVINLTSPALFHVLGILFIIFILHHTTNTKRYV